MEPQRLRGIAGACFVLALTLFFPFSEFLFYRAPTPQELFGFVGGILLGGFICASINGFWDPVQLKPLRPDPLRLPWWVRHGRRRRMCCTLPTTQPTVNWALSPCPTAAR